MTAMSEAPAPAGAAGRAATVSGLGHLTMVTTGGPHRCRAGGRIRRVPGGTTVSRGEPAREPGGHAR